MQFKTALFLVASASLASAQNCKPDILMDDFSHVKIENVDGALRNTNLVGGDYGGNQVDFSFTQRAAGVAGKVSVVPRTPQADNYFFFKVNPQACYDLTGYTALRVEMRAPVGATSKFTLTQKTKDCRDIINGIFILSF